MEVHARLNNLRISPRKVRLLAGVIRGLDVNQAQHQLNMIVKKSSTPLSKLLSSAVANATNNFNLEENNLFVKDVNVDEGPKLKRYRPKGFGRTSPIEKKTSHVRIILEEKVVGLKAKKAKKKIDEPVQVQELAETMEEVENKSNKFDVQKPEVKKEIGKKKGTPVFRDVKKFFRRKTI